jgi:hypothetical protein
MKREENNFTMRLTALWALSESGLGGAMHAFKIPFTGFFLGGFAILIVCLIAYHSTQKWKAIIQATLLVILIKVSASPQSPPMAYVAVAFQGLIGALLFYIIPIFRLAAVLSGMLALFESATQKFLLSTLIFGKSIWEALDLFFKDILKTLSLSTDISFSFWLIFIYTLIYTIWGMLLGWWGASLPATLEKESIGIIEKYRHLEIGTEQEVNPSKKRKHKLWGLLLVLLFVCITFLIQSNRSKVFYSIARTIAAMLILIFLISPLIKWLIQKWLVKAKKEKQQAISQLMDIIPELKSYVKPAMQLAKESHNGLMVYKAFTINLIVISLYHQQD